MLRKCITAAVATFLLLTGCSNKVETVKEQDNEIEQLQKESEEFRYQYPLTGIPTKEASDTRAVAAMINNHPKARQQSGLNQADIVYEILAEGNVTRFLAIFQSEKPEKIGPIRSARDYYIELAKAYDGLFIAHGYSPDAKRMLDSGYIDNLNGMQYDGSLFKRSPNRVAPHNSYITYEKILEGAEKNNFTMKKAPEPLKFLTKKEVENLDGPAVNKVSVNFANSASFTATYEYDKDLGKFKRFSNGAQTVDNETGDPILLDNVLIVETVHRIIDNSGRRAIDLTSGGRAYLLQKGIMREVEWTSQAGRMVPSLNGTVLGLVPGKTWINVVPTNPGLSRSVKVEANEAD